MNQPSIAAIFLTGIERRSVRHYELLINLSDFVVAVKRKQVWKEKKKKKKKELLHALDNVWASARVGVGVAVVEVVRVIVLVADQAMPVKNIDL